jgi:hypothetical protein
VLLDGLRVIHRHLLLVAAPNATHAERLTRHDREQRRPEGGDAVLDRLLRPLPSAIIAITPPRRSRYRAS